MWALMKSEPTWRSLAQFAVLVIIADQVNDEGDARRGVPPGWAWPSKAGIARRLKCSSRYVPKVITELEAIGLLEVRRSVGPRGANLYRPILTSAVQFTPQQSTSAVQFTSMPTTACKATAVAAVQPVNGSAATGEPYAATHEPGSTGGVPSSSPELLRELLTEPLKEPLMSSTSSVRSEHDDDHRTYLRLKAIADQRVLFVASEDELRAAVQSLEPDCPPQPLANAVRMSWLARCTGNLRRQAVSA
jgi:hypothetical protein